MSTCKLPSTEVSHRGFRAWIRRLRDKVRPRAHLSREVPSPIAEHQVIEPMGISSRQNVRSPARRNDRLMAPLRESLAQVPPLPHLVRELLSELSDPTSNARSVARIASSDPALAASLIRTVNAAAYGLSRKVTSVTEAVSYLGYSVVRSLLVRMRLEQMLPNRNTGGYDAEDLWIHSMAVSYAADLLAATVQGVDRGFVATLGLLHDIGKLAINNQFPDSAARLHRRDPGLAGQTFLERERLLLGADHAEIGAILAGHWRLPTDLIEAIRWHHAPLEMPATLAESVRRSAGVVHIANQLAKYCYVYGEDVEIDIIDPRLLKDLGLSTSLSELLNKPMRRAISRAVFFAEEGSTRTLHAIRRFLRMCRPAEAAAIVAMPAPANRSRVRVLSKEETDRASADPRPGLAVFSGYTTRLGLRAISEKAVGHLDSQQMDESIRQPMRFVLRRTLANVVSSVDSPFAMRVAVEVSNGGASMMLSSNALEIRRRAPMAIEVDQRMRLLEREWANVLNLGWFGDVGSSECGRVLCFRSDGAGRSESARNAA